MAATLPAFKLPSELTSSSKASGWAPATTLPSHTTGLPLTQQQPDNDNTGGEEQKSATPDGNDNIDILSMFAPFNKSDRLGKISDFTQSADHYSNRARTNRDSSVVGGTTAADGSDITFQYKQDRVEDNSFTLVDSRTQSNPSQPKRGGFQQRGGFNRQFGGRGGGVGGGAAAFQRSGAMSSAQTQARAAPGTQGNKPNKPAWGTGSTTNLVSRASTGFGTQTTTARSGTINVSARQVAAAQRQAQYMNQRRRGFGYQQQVEEIERPQSVTIEPQYEQLHEWSIGELNSATAECTAVTDITTAGTLKTYNTQYNRVTPRNPITLNRYENKQFFTATTSEDSILNKLSETEEEGVYATDSIVSLLMSANKTVQTWDIVVRKMGKRIVLDKRASSKIDYLTVGENVVESNTQYGNDNASRAITDSDNINHPDNLSLEATFINHNFSQQILSSKASDTVELEQANPFLDALQDGYEPAAVAYKYRQFQLPTCKLTVRCSINAFINTNDKTQYVISRALNEYDSKHSNTIDYRQRLEQQTGAILASEMKNNMSKLTRWTAEAVLSGVEQVRLGFVSRLNTKNNYKHQILMTKLYTPSTLADSLSVKVRSLWGNLSTIVRIIQQQPDGTYLLLRDANKPAVRLYSVPDGTFADELQDITTVVNPQAPTTPSSAAAPQE